MATSAGRPQKPFRRLRRVGIKHGPRSFAGNVGHGRTPRGCELIVIAVCGWPFLGSGIGGSRSATTRMAPVVGGPQLTAIMDLRQSAGDVQSRRLASIKFSGRFCQGNVRQARLRDVRIIGSGGTDLNPPASDPVFRAAVQKALPWDGQLAQWRRGFGRPVFPKKMPLGQLVPEGSRGQGALQRLRQMRWFNISWLAVFAQANGVLRLLPRSTRCAINCTFRKRSTNAGLSEKPTCMDVSDHAGISNYPHSGKSLLSKGANLRDSSMTPAARISAPSRF